MSFAENEYKRWLANGKLSDEERSELLGISDKPEEIESRFYAPLEFGTAGLRGVMGVGLNRMNAHIIRWVTQAFAEVIRSDYGGGDVAVCYDSRYNSRFFAETAACVLAANDIHVLFFGDMRPTPELSFAVREYNCAAGINITASHNTSEYNGYKVYGSNGAQLPPKSAERVAEIMRENDIFSAPEALDFNEAVSSGLIKILGAETDEQYTLKVLSLSTGRLAKPDLRVLYTPFHGTGRDLVPSVLRRDGFRCIYTVPTQMTPDGGFPTVKSPNPEYPESFAEALEIASIVNADIIIGTDPDADRVAVMAKHGGEYVHINGHSAGALLLDYYIEALKKAGKLPENPVVLKSIVTTDLAREIAESHGVRCYDTFTGFKFMAERKDEIENAGSGHVIFSYEESYGCMLGDFVRDKDAVSASMLIAEMSAYWYSQGLSLIDALDSIYKRYGYRRESTVSLVMPGVNGLKNMQALMLKLRSEPPEIIANRKITGTRDYLSGVTIDREGVQSPLDLTGSDVVRFDLDDGTAIIIRPSGTEPKIKVYILVRGETPEDCENKTRLYETWVNEYFK